MSGSGPPTGGRIGISPTRRRRAAFRKIRAAGRSRRVTTAASPTSGFRARFSKADPTCVHQATAAATGRPRATPSRSTPQPAMSASVVSFTRGQGRDEPLIAPRVPDKSRVGALHRAMNRSAFHVGYKTSIIALFIAVVLFVGLTLVYLSFERVAAMTQTAASSFIDKVAQLGASRIDAQFADVRDCLQILARLPSVQSGEVADDARLHGVMAAMLRNNEQLFNLYVGYADGSFLEMDVIDRAGAEFRSNLGAPADAVFRLFVVSRAGGAVATRSVIFLSDSLTAVGSAPASATYDPRTRPWYVDAMGHENTLITGPYIFYATGLPGYTLRIPLREGRPGVVAGDILLSRTEAMLLNQRLGRSSSAFLFDDANRIVAHPQMSDLLTARSDLNALPRIDDLKIPGLTRAIVRWRVSGVAQQFFRNGGRSYVAAFQPIETAGSANVRLAVVAPIDEFFSRILAERRGLFALALGFVAAVLPFVFWLGARLARSLRELARQTDSIQ